MARARKFSAIHPDCLACLPQLPARLDGGGEKGGGGVHRLISQSVDGTYYGTAMSVQ